MALKLKTQPAVVEKPLAQRVDDLGELELEVATLEAKITASPEAKELALKRQMADGERAALRDAMGVELDPEDETHVLGTYYKAKLGVAANRRAVVHPEKVIEFLEPDELVAILNFKLGDLDKYLTPPQLAQVLEESRTGPRQFKLEKK